MNEYFYSIKSWRKEDIEKRSDYLADIVLQIWSYFGNESAQPSQLSSVTGSTPKKLYFLGQEHIVKSWRDVLYITLDSIYDLDSDYFAKIVQQFPRFVAWSDKDFRSVKKLRNGSFVEANLSAQDIDRFCRKAIETAELSSDEWRVETS